MLLYLSILLLHYHHMYYYRTFYHSCKTIALIYNVCSSNVTTRLIPYFDHYVQNIGRGHEFKEKKNQWLTVHTASAGQSLCC